MMAVAIESRIKMDVSKPSVIAEFSIVPMDLGKTSLGPWVARALTVIGEVPGVRYQLTPMGTIIEAHDLESVMKAVSAAHESLFEMGTSRVLSTLRIDDRRDRPRQMEDKVKSVQKHLSE
jgi:uncharacterized protein (TIGR00106 family)